MTFSDITFFRAGYVTTLDVWKRYLVDGRDIHFRTLPVVEAHGKTNTECSDDSEDSDENEEEDEGEDDVDNEEQQTSRPPLSEEERQWMKKSEAIFQSVTKYRQAFRTLYRKAPLETRTRLVLPHTTRSTMLMVLYRGFTRIVRLPELEGGKFFEWSIFIPTSWGYSSTRARGPSNIDRERIQTFVDVANSLIKDDARRDGGGFKLSEPDFKFKRIPDWGVSRPLLASRELKDVMNAGPESFQLWGLTPREFLRPYYML